MSYIDLYSLPILINYVEFNVVQNYENNFWNFHQEDKKSDTFSTSLYQLIKTYFSMFKGKPVSQDKLINEMIASMNAYGYKVTLETDPQSFELNSSNFGNQCFKQEVQDFHDLETAQETESLQDNYQ